MGLPVQDKVSLDKKTDGIHVLFCDIPRRHKLWFDVIIDTNDLIGLKLKILVLTVGDNFLTYTVLLITEWRNEFARFVS